MTYILLLPTTRESGRKRAEIGLKFICWFGGKAQYSLTTLVAFHVFFHFFLVLRIWKWCLGTKLQFKSCSHLLFSFKRNEFPTEMEGKQQFLQHLIYLISERKQVFGSSRKPRVTFLLVGMIKESASLEHFLINIPLQEIFAREGGATRTYMLTIPRILMLHFNLRIIHSTEYKEPKHHSLALISIYS